MAYIRQYLPPTPPPQYNVDQCEYEKQPSHVIHVSALFCVFRVPKGLEDVSKYPKLLEELLRRGYSEEDVSKVVGKNLIIAMEKMEKVTMVHFRLRSLLRAFKQTLKSEDDASVLSTRCFLLLGSFIFALFYQFEQWVVSPLKFKLSGLAFP